MNISYSRVSSYLSCPYKHYLGYVQGLKLKKPERPLYFGTDFHRLLELRHKPEELKKAKQDIGSKFYELKPQFQAELGDDYIWDLATIFADYQDIYKESPQPTVTEQKFQIKLGIYKGETIYFKGFIDELYKYKSKSTGKKSIKIGEHKAFTRKPDQSLLVMNTQKCLYSKACEILYGILPDTVIWDYVHSKPASEPIWLEKSQRFSAAKSDKITPYSWRRACDKKGITDEKILSEGDKYSANISNFFFRCELEVLPVMVEDIWSGFVYQAKQIARQGNQNRTKNITPSCAWCSYQPICYAECTGANTQYLIDKDYTRYERKEESE